MKIATRLTILLVLVATLVALSVGWFAVDASTRSQYNNLDSEINAVVRSGIGHPTQALSNALNIVQENAYDLSLDVVDPSGSVVQINTGRVPLQRRPTEADVHAALDKVIGLSDLPGFRVRSLNVGGGDYLLVAGSTGTITSQNESLAIEVALAGFLVAVVMLVLARFVMRSDLRTMARLITFASAVARGDEAGQIPESAGSRDVRELQAALATMVDALHERIAIEARSVEAMQQFIGDASHELRTPLTVIKGYNEILTNPSANSEQRGRAVERVTREIERMDSLVADLLLAAEVREAPRHTEQKVPLSALLSSRADEFAAENPERVFTSTIEPFLFVRGREDLFDRLLINSFSNIVRHTATTGEVRVSLTRDGSRAVLRVEDAGPGLPEYGVRPQRFRRFDQSRSRETGGSGLGMSIMADITEGLGGTLVTSQSDLGGLALTFAFDLDD